MRENGAIDGARTRDIQDHNLALYQLSYDRRMPVALGAGGRGGQLHGARKCHGRGAGGRARSQSIANPTQPWGSSCPPGCSAMAR